MKKKFQRLQLNKTKIARIGKIEMSVVKGGIVTYGPECNTMNQNCATITCHCGGGTYTEDPLRCLSIADCTTTWP